MGIDMAVFKNGTFWRNVGYGAGGVTHSAGMRRAQYYIKDGDIFAVTMAGDAEIGGKEMLFIAKGDSSLTEARRVSLPKDEDLSVAGVGELEGETVLLASAEEKSGAMGAEKKEGYGLIIPIDRDTIKLDLTDSRRIDVSPTGGVASKDGLLLFMSGAELYITDGKDTKRLANIEEAGFNAASRVSRIRPLEDGRILMVVENQLVELSPTEEGTIPETKTITLTLAVRGGLTDEAQELIGRFNRAQKDIMVETKSCRDVAALNLALLGHEVDLISETDLLLMRNYTEKGRLASFDEVCPAVLEEGKLLSNIVEATKVEGKVAFLPRSFSVGGYFTAEEALTDSEDLADLWEKAAAADPVLPKTYLDSLWVRDVAARNADEWIDWETRTCYFDNGSFESLIVFAQKCSHADEEALAHAEHERHLGMVHIGNPLNAGGEERILFAPPLEKDDGWEIEPDTFYAVAAGGNTEAARKFMEFIFLESSEGEKNARYFPVNSAALEAYLTPVREEDQPEEVFEETKKTFAAVRALVINADHYGYFENALTEIITEEVTNCLSGNITAAKAAEYIQNRVQLYLDEQG